MIYEKFSLFGKAHWGNKNRKKVKSFEIFRDGRSVLFGGEFDAAVFRCPTRFQPTAQAHGSVFPDSVIIHFQKLILKITSLK